MTQLSRTLPICPGFRSNPAIEIAVGPITFHKPTSRYRSAAHNLASFRVADNTSGTNRERKNCCVRILSL